MGIHVKAGFVSVGQIRGKLPGMLHVATGYFLLPVPTFYDYNFDSHYPYALPGELIELIFFIGQSPSLYLPLLLCSLNGTRLSFYKADSAVGGFPT